MQLYRDQSRLADRFYSGPALWRASGGVPVFAGTLSGLDQTNSERQKLYPDFVPVHPASAGAGRFSVLFFRAYEAVFSEIHLDYPVGKTLVHSGLQHFSRKNRIKRGQDQYAWIL